MSGSIAMNGGDGPNSYSKNSKYQQEGLSIAKDLLIDSIQEKLTIPDSDLGIFRIADLGCSVGPNTFTCVQAILQAVKTKFIKTQNCNSKVPEFQVFFNDHVDNDFNTLFKNLPLEREYMAAGVPGSFCGRLFPKASMNLINSTFALHWLTKIPEELTKEDSPAWNKGSVTCIGGRNEVFEAFRAQFLRDANSFFGARSLELVKNGVLVVLLPSRPDGSQPSKDPSTNGLNYVGRVLYDMAKEGLVRESLIDSFNLPIYIPTSSDLREVISNNQNLSIEISEKILFPRKIMTREESQVGSLHIRAVTESILCKHFGSEIIDEFFRRFADKSSCKPRANDSSLLSKTVRSKLQYSCLPPSYKVYVNLLQIFLIDIVFN
ncbi:hypothetical protein ACFE04_030252 [Oxalis oulophora]